ncbi:universal stress protein [Halopseudomonas yangmingensis]|uniref:Nucleotide-binding universal stress protein, UspA family n=1 Tax=Halopseudomonas yangmingensis TaxID=1720063 RepID=A0A1I4T9R3_9GAMM|nr:universal stress protein [Halopseudomonas yangmingensis]SFM73538.1 Nucleotide-binding universal stress protein, UspA family [Halopseudomonas yangmingensis]
MYQRILLPIDLNHKASWNKALPAALQLCQDHGASLHLLTVLPNFGMPLVGGFFPKEFAERVKKEISEGMKTFVRDNVPKDIKVQRIVADGKPWEAILRISNKIDADLIVMASHKRKKIEEFLIGTNAMRVVQQSKRSVLIVR